MIGIIGAGGHAKVIAELFQAASPHTKLIFFSSTPDQSSSFFARYDHYTDLPESLAHHLQSILHWHVAIGSIDIRKKKIAALEQLKCKLISAVHPTAILSPKSTVGTGSSVMAGAIVNSEAVIGKGCIINTGAIIDHDCHIGDFTNIGPGCRLAGGVTVGDQTELGTGTIVIPNVTIGKNCTIGAGSVVIRDIPDGSRAVGVPAKCLD